MTREAKRLYDAARYREKRVAILAHQAAWRRNNPDLAKQRANEGAKKWQAKNRARLAAYNRRWREANRNYFTEWSRTHRHITNAYDRSRDAAEKRAAPKWRNSFFIAEIYDLARLRTRFLGVAHHVDHIVPLRHPLVCGLHVENNLRIITAKENLQKGNRRWEGMP